MGEIIKAYLTKVGAIPQSKDDWTNHWTWPDLLTFNLNNPCFNGLSTKLLRKLNKQLNKELKKRATEKHNECQKLEGGWIAFANFMSCACVAMACRATLRKQKGFPVLGKTPQSGEMWTPREIYQTYNYINHRLDMLGLVQWSGNPFNWEYSYLDEFSVKTLHQGLGLSEVAKDTEIPF